ncbi:oxygenase MpaB family protein [Goodfellowiella coeruleoviolacea]|uniref:oxygenase MpaB family protein n=1 Tax=Goodfellowiella coeruleoviolacea TaxID=334858 RepID=UPI0020A5EF4D|nr:oxygenase MpaB family protein [Goodfellowiella coeruleoviolacea]
MAGLRARLDSVLGVRDRYARLATILALDPERDHQKILRLSAAYEFPWDYRRALELALFRTYCVPSISALLAATGEFANRAQRRYDDTALLMGELVEHGYDSPRGRESLRVVNGMHRRYRIDNGDMKYVLSTFVYDPIAWIDQFGWRRLTDHERLAAFHFYRAVGQRMGITDLPEGYAEFAEFKRDYEHTHFRYATTNHEIGCYTLDLVCSWYPRPVRPLVAQVVLSLLDRGMLDAFAFTAPPAWVGPAARSALRTRAALVQLLPPRRTSRLLRDPRNRTYPGYPNGYRISQLGAAPPTDIDPRWLSRPIPAQSRATDSDVLPPG